MLLKPLKVTLILTIVIIGFYSDNLYSQIVIKDEFFDSERVELEPLLIQNTNNTTMRIGFVYLTEVRDYVIIKVVVSHIDRIERLRLKYVNYDKGSYIKEASSVNPTQYKSNSSSRRFKLKYKYIKNLITSDRVIIRLDLSQGNYLNGLIIKGSQTIFDNRLKRWLKLVEERR